MKLNRYCNHCGKETEHTVYFTEENQSCGYMTILMCIITLGIGLIYILTRKKSKKKEFMCQQCGATSIEKR